MTKARCGVGDEVRERQYVLFRSDLGDSEVDAVVKQDLSSVELSLMS